MVGFKIPIGALRQCKQRKAEASSMLIMYIGKLP
jgi:hypothetical protein